MRLPIFHRHPGEGRDPRRGWALASWLKRA